VKELTRRKPRSQAIRPEDVLDTNRGDAVVNTSVVIWSRGSKRRKPSTLAIGGLSSKPRRSDENVEGRTISSSAAQVVFSLVAPFEDMLSLLLLQRIPDGLHNALFSEPALFGY
jgi:hypothetical protein